MPRSHSLIPTWSWGKGKENRKIENSCLQLEHPLANSSVFPKQDFCLLCIMVAQKLVSRLGTW